MKYNRFFLINNYAVFFVGEHKRRLGVQWTEESHKNAGKDDKSGA
jgi:hypothetical protein